MPATWARLVPADLIRQSELAKSNRQKIAEFRDRAFEIDQAAYERIKWFSIDEVLICPAGAGNAITPCVYSISNVPFSNAGTTRNQRFGNVIRNFGLEIRLRNTSNMGSTVVDTYLRFIVVLDMQPNAAAVGTITSASLFQADLPYANIKPELQDRYMVLHDKVWIQNCVASCKDIQPSITDTKKISIPLDFATTYLPNAAPPNDVNLVNVTSNRIMFFVADSGSSERVWTIQSRLLFLDSTSTK